MKDINSTKLLGFGAVGRRKEACKESASGLRSWNFQTHRRLHPLLAPLYYS